MTSFADSIRRRRRAVSDGLAWLPPVLLRLSLAAIFIPAGWGKLNNLAWVTGYFTRLGIPAPHFNAALVGCVEFTCGVLLAVGLIARLAALPLVVNMTVAILAAKRDAVGGVLDLMRLDEFLYIAILITIAVYGAGAISLDAARARLRRDVARGRSSFGIPDGAQI